YVHTRTGDEVCASVASTLLSRVPISGNVIRPSMSIVQINERLPKRMRTSFQEMQEKLRSMRRLGLFANDSVPGMGDDEKVVTDFKIDVEGVLQQIQFEHARALVQTRYGDVGARMFVLLRKHKRLVETQVAEMAICAKKEARELLHKMMRAGFTQVLHVPRDAARRPNRMMYFWTVNFTEVCKILVDMYYFSWCNLAERCLHEGGKIKPVHVKIGQGITLTVEEKGTLEKWDLANKKLRDSMIKIGGLIRLFRDFE
ncbi:hypothetical protein AAMO2058_000741500, partial [Amorphochlora amoebiformis]